MVCRGGPFSGESLGGPPRADDGFSRRRVISVGVGTMAAETVCPMRNDTPGSGLTWIRTGKRCGNRPGRPRKKQIAPFRPARQ
jgi:hypothetical protein